MELKEAAKLARIMCQDYKSCKDCPACGNCLINQRYDTSERAVEKFEQALLDWQRKLNPTNEDKLREVFGNLPYANDVNERCAFLECPEDNDCEVCPYRGWLDQPYKKPDKEK